MTGGRPLGTVLVTGAGGFLGGAVVAALRRGGVAVVGTDVVAGEGVAAGLGGPAGAARGDAARAGVSNGLVEACDVTDPAAVAAAFAGRRIDTVLHIGAVSGPMVMADDPAAIVRINVAGTAHVCDAARRHGVGRLVLASSVDVYGTTPGLVDETTPPRPATVYGASKLAAEAVVAGFAAEHGLDAVTLRLGWIYGPGRRTPTTLERMVRGALAGEPVTVDADGEEATHYVALGDAVRAVVAAAAVADPGERVLNVTAGRGRPMHEVAAALARVVPGAEVRFAGGRSAAGPDGYDATRAARTLGWRADTALEDGLQLMAAALR